ncbi:hypothetical protein E3U43_002181 [Larimichthys crocea]|uniref:Uncharacterized protein n=1 Tax=Larimichthys crocea TaxID=215358 RepID=A0ACD3QQS3_LARCR|nr:hypothetical protein E3U43_002181 [Larimichthys crocea]
MAATVTVNRPPPAHPGLIGGNVQSRPNGSELNSGLQDPGLQQEPGPSSQPQHHVTARPIFYVPAPPPPPFLQYQWPMPFSYNPFAGVPGMGYGMVMPPFPPPPFMEAPAYILPHPPIQPVDYRRLLHPQVHPSSAPYQNPNQTRRFRPPHTGPVRETVNSSVQTEPTQSGYGDGSPLVISDSGHGTASNSSSSSSSSSQKRDCADVENYVLPNSNTNDLEVNRTCVNGTIKHGFDIQHPTGTKIIQSSIKATAETQTFCKNSVSQETVPPYKNGHCNMWSVSSQDSMVPVCSSSQQEDEAVKERRVSVPDILMSWGDATPQATRLKIADKLGQNDLELPSYETEVEREKSVNQNATEAKNGPVVADVENAVNSKDSEALFKILKLPSALHELLSESIKENESLGLVGSTRQCLPSRDDLQRSINESYKLPEDEQENGNETNLHEDTSEIIPYQMSKNNFQIKKKMNESVWSVESLAPFIPTKELSLQRGMFEPEIIIEMTEEAENGRPSTQNDNLIVKSTTERRQSRRFSSPDSIPISDNWLIYSTPAEKQRQSEKPEMQSENDASEMTGPKQDQSMAPLEKIPLDSLTYLQSKENLSTPTKQDMNENGSSEPEANQSPNQESLTINEQQEKSPCSPEQKESLPLNSATEKKISSVGPLLLQNGADMCLMDRLCGNEEVSQLGNEQLCVPMADQTIVKVSPSKGHLVDCGIQCTGFLCPCEKVQYSMGLSRGPPFECSDMRKANGGKAQGGFHKNENIHKNQKRHGQWRNRGQEKQSSQQEAYNDNCGKSWKSKGGNGRNPRY